MMLYVVFLIFAVEAMLLKMLRLAVSVRQRRAAMKEVSLILGEAPSFRVCY